MTKTYLHPLDGIARENIKITDVRVTLLSCAYPEEELLYVVNSIWWKADVIIVEVFTDQGIVGLGGASRYGGDAERVRQYIEETVKPVITGKNPFDLEFLACGGDIPLKRAAWAGVDAALWDIVGKAKGLPVYTLLAAGHEPRPRIRVYASAGVKYTWYDRPETLIDEAVALKERGYTAYKFRPGTDWTYSGVTLAQFIPYLEKMRAAVGPDFDLALEKKPWSLTEALELAPVLGDLGFLWFEEPMALEDPDAIEKHRQLKAALPTVMISGGEGFLNRVRFKDWMDPGAYTMLQPDVGRMGLSEAWRTVRMAHLAGVPFCPHTWEGGPALIENAHLVAASPNALMQEVFETWDPLKTEVFKEPVAVVDGYMALPDRPGFGVELAPDLEKRFPYIPGRFTRPNPIMA